MKKFFQKSLLVILLLFGGVHAAYADYLDADSYNGHFKIVETAMSLDAPYVTWKYVYLDDDGYDDVVRHSRFYVGGSEASLIKYNTDPKYYFKNPWEKGTEMLYENKKHDLNMRQNPEYGVVNHHKAHSSGSLHIAENRFYPGEKMGPAQMCGFFIRWTGWWDIDDDGGDGYWMGMSRSSNIGNSNYGADWNRKEGKGIVRYGKMTYNLPATKAATFTRKPGGKIAVSVTGNIHDSWNEYYGFGKDKSVDDYGYYENNDYGTVQLNNTTGAASYTLKEQLPNGTFNETFDETQNYTIYYHEYYKRTQDSSTQIGRASCRERV